MKKFLTAFFSVLTAVLFTCALGACNPGEGGGVQIELSKQSLTLREGGASDTVVATVSGAEGYVTWAIEDDDVASIIPTNNICIVRPVAEGATNLTATIGETSVSCPVTVGPPEEVETVTIFYNGTDVSTLTEPLSVEKGGTLTLTATASMDSAVNWMSDNEAVATVAGGVVTALRPGTVTVTAYVTASIRATVSITVTAPAGSVYYDLLRGEEGGTVDLDDEEPLTADTYFYWSARSEWGMQQVDVDYAYYEDGTVYFSYDSDWDPGFSYGFQLFYKNSGHTLGNNYKLTCTINVDQDCFVTLNGTVLELKEGDNDVTVYYTYTDGLGSGGTYGISSFDLTMGYADGSDTGYFVKKAVVSVSDVAWEADVPERLEAPSFTYNQDTGVITITDPNEEGVGSYRLDFYEGGSVKGSVTVTNGGVVDTARIANGTYTVRLVAVGSNSHYLESAPSDSTAEIVVSNEGGPSYTPEKTGAQGAAAAPGIWTYYAESWVAFEGKFEEGVLNVTFSNNSGNWYDTQLFYRDPNAVTGSAYEITLEITSSAAGRVTICGSVVTLKQGTDTYTVTVTQGSAETIQIIFGVSGEDNNQDIKDGTVSVEIISVEETSAPAPSTGSFVNGDEAQAVANPGTYIYWNDQNWVGTNVSVTAAEIDDGELTLTYSGASEVCWFGMQLFYKDADLVAGQTYTLTLNIHASAAGSITVNDQVKELTVGDNAITVEYTESESLASLRLQFGVENPASVIAGGTFVISGITFTASGEAA